MNLHFSTEQWVPYPVELVFAFFANPGNLPHLMPSWQKARIEEQRIAPPPPRPISSNPERQFRSPAAGQGSHLTISFRPLPLSPVRWPWEAVITEFIWNHHFCDEQERGPFRFWHHCHTTLDDPQGGLPGTLVRDEVEYGLPYGKLGHLLNATLITHRIRAIFAHRQRRLAQILPVVARQATQRA